MAEEQKARMQAIKDSEFRAANDDGEPATDLAGVGPSSLSPPEALVAKKWCKTHGRSAPPCGARMNCNIIPVLVVRIEGEKTTDE